MKRLYLLFGLLLALCCLSYGQITIDATGPVRQRKREPSTGGGGSIGRKLPLRVSIDVRRASPEADGKMIVEFTLTNLGKEQIVLPVSPHAGDLERAGTAVSYTNDTLALFVNSIDDRDTRVLSGGAVLFGSPEFEGTLVSLAPSESIQVLTRVSLPKHVPKGMRFVAYAGLGRETISTSGKKISSYVENVGSSSSREYTANELLSAN